ncbi:MAG TPA: sensor domain-containing diguanylate cyclase [Gemmatimonadales bacterium]|nr:sensor domain-containing diguanylate cyclase [Gemmatimonadales bacterium]
MLGWTIRWRPGRLRRRGPPPLGLREILDLLRQAYGATAGWGVGTGDGPFEVPIALSANVGVEERRRGAALVQLASVDGRLHIVRDPERTYVAVGDFPYAAGLVFEGPAQEVILVDVVAGALRRFVAGMRLADEQSAIPRARVVAGRVSRLMAGALTLEGMARAAVQLGEQITHRGVALAVIGDEHVRVIAVSGAADRRLAGVQLSADSPVARAVVSGIPVATRGAEDVFGAGVPERRRSERAGTAYPLLDGSIVVGALVLLGPPLEPDTEILDELSPLLSDLGPRIAAARAVHDAERRAVVDPLTGLRNRREFERALSGATEGSLIYVDLDHFKKLNDTLGHPAGDAALKHVARLLEAAVRDGDLVARIGGEEFAVWLPRTALREGLEVAERIRRSIAEQPLRWTGTVYPLTTSCGIASCPELVGDVLNLPTAADAALYRAKQEGRNRVEKAAASG